MVAVFFVRVDRVMVYAQERGGVDYVSADGGAVFDFFLLACFEVGASRERAVAVFVVWVVAGFRYV